MQNNIIRRLLFALALAGTLRMTAEPLLAADAGAVTIHPKPLSATATDKRIQQNEPNRATTLGDWEVDWPLAGEALPTPPPEQNDFEPTEAESLEMEARRAEAEAQRLREQAARERRDASAQRARSPAGGQDAEAIRLDTRAAENEKKAREAEARAREARERAGRLTLNSLK